MLNVVIALIFVGLVSYGLADEMTRRTLKWFRRKDVPDNVIRNIPRLFGIYQAANVFAILVVVGAFNWLWLVPWAWFCAWNGSHRWVWKYQYLPAELFEL